MTKHLKAIGDAGDAGEQLRRNLRARQDAFLQLESTSLGGWDESLRRLAVDQADDLGRQLRADGDDANQLHRTLMTIDAAISVLPGGATAVERPRIASRAVHKASVGIYRTASDLHEAALHVATVARSVAGDVELEARAKQAIDRGVGLVEDAQRALFKALADLDDVVENHGARTLVVPPVDAAQRGSTFMSAGASRRRNDDDRVVDRSPGH